MMSNCQKKCKCGAIWLACVTFIIVAAVALGIVFGVKGLGVFNKSAVLDDSKTLTVSMNQHVYLNDLDKIEETCEAVFGDVKPSYQMKGEMSGDESEIVYVFDKDVDLQKIEKDLEAKFATLTADDGELKGSFIYVSANGERTEEYLAKDYVLRGVIAGVVLVAAIYVYAAIRFGIGKGVGVALATLIGTLLTAAIIILARIPVTASVSYVFGVTALLSAVTSVLSMNKIAVSEKSNEKVCACKEILTIGVLTAAALVILAAVAPINVKWFALMAFVAVAAAVVSGIELVPAIYAPIKSAADKKPAKDGYVGAVKGEKKEKKAPAKKEMKVAEKKELSAPVVEEKAAEPVAEPVAESVVEAVEEPVAEPVVEAVEEPAVEETVEEVAEEPAIEENVEEVAEEPAVEEVAEEVAEEPVVESVEEAPVEEVETVAETEEAVEETPTEEVTEE
jgi:preprotein translocase subunit SecF